MSMEMRDRGHEEILKALAGLATATLHEAMGKRNALWPGIRPLWPEMSVCGPAFTVRSKPGDNLAVHRALAVAPAGAVLVITFQADRPGPAGDSGHGGWGEITTAAAQARGLVGLVTDGAVRDAEACRRLGFPIFSQGISICGTTKEDAGEVGSPITCGGVAIRSGDYVRGDHDGVVIVPAEEAEAIIDLARRRDEREASIISRLRAGELTIDLLGLRAALEKHP
jgi:4-hydroxy-4-methyl-2-oxoglutarate aldolase